MINKPISRKASIVIQELEKEILIYDLNINKAFCLNETSGFIYQLCDGTKTVAEISDVMSVKMKTLVSEDFVWLALRQLEKENLLENGEEINNPFAGVSRREVIRKVGLASMVMLPVISSLVAPTALMAQSGGNVALFGACTSTSQCQSGLNCTTCFRGPCTGQNCCSGTGGQNGPSAVIYTGFIQPDCATCLDYGVNLLCCSGTGTLISCAPIRGGGGVDCSFVCT